MFWSLILEPGKRYSSTVSESFHLSMATLDVKSCKSDSDVYPVSVEVGGQELLLCNLSKTTSPHASLDLMFNKGDEITFSSKGKATVHLTGYCLQDDMTDDEDDYSSLEEEDEESFNDLVRNTKKASGSGEVKSEGKSKNANKRKLEPIEAISKKKPKGGKVESDDDDDDDDEDDSDDLSGDLDDSKLGQLVDSINTEGDSSDDNDEDDSDIDDEEEENSDDSEGEDEVDDEEKDDDEDDEDDSDSEEESGQKPNKKQEVKTPVSNKQKTPVSNKKQDKQKNELTNGTTPQSSKKDKNKNQANQQTPKQAAAAQKTPSKDGQKTPKKGESTPQSQKKTTLNGGVVVEELKPGNGQPAKYGKNVQVYYTGRLKTNNRVFDQTNSGPGFKFRLGNGEVIKGWDVALNGMKVGGKRRITIPPAMAYGSKGSPPTIPPNSWLVFDVELKSVN